MQLSPSTPKIELDPNFSRILQKKREEQLEASKQRLFDSTLMSSKSESLFETNTSAKKMETIEVASAVTRKDYPAELDNSMMFDKVLNRSWDDLSGGEDSFLALERQCRMDDKKERLLNANDTMLFDVEPPSELWNQTVNQSLPIDTLDQSQDEETIEMSPVKYVGLTRPSTIIEETSSQMESLSKHSSSSTTTNTATKSSLYATASMVNESTASTASTASAVTAKESSNRSCEVSLNKSQMAKADTLSSSSLSLSSSNLSKVSPLSSQNLHTSTKAERQRRGTFAFKRANYTFFPNENLDPIDESDSLIDDNNLSRSKSERGHHIETPKHLQTKKSPVKAAEVRKKDLLDFGTPAKEAADSAISTSDNAEVSDTDTDHSISNEEDDKDQFNNTLERVDYLLEKGKKILEETPICKRSRDHSMFETPLFSCKRKRLLSEMASMEMLPLPKRGPLIDFSTPEVTNAKRVSKFTGK